MILNIFFQKIIKQSKFAFSSKIAKRFEPAAEANPALAEAFGFYSKGE